VPVVLQIATWLPYMSESDDCVRSRSPTHEYEFGHQSWSDSRALSELDNAWSPLSFIRVPIESVREETLA
jgi:hypothetical protein